MKNQIRDAVRRVFIGIGSNVGDRHRHIETARDQLARLPKTRLVKFSGIYQTPPAGPVEQGPYLNAVAELATELTPHALLAELRRIEAGAGREPAECRQRWGPRTLDLDILLYGEQTIDEPGLRVPHPRMHERWFVLRPLADLAPDARHPAMNASVAELLEHLPADAPRGELYVPPADTPAVMAQPRSRDEADA